MRASDDLGERPPCYCPMLTGSCPRHPGIPVNIPLRNTGIRLYDDLPQWPRAPYAPMRNLLRPAGRCYTLPSGNKVHVKPGCRC